LKDIQPAIREAADDVVPAAAALNKHALLFTQELKLPGWTIPRRPVVLTA
jgi:hypothetical protein